MRIDKFLKNARIIKRRTVANEACSNGRVTVNDRAAKAGTMVKPGDIVEIRYGNQLQKYRILEVSDHVKKEDAEKMYELID